MKLVKTDLYSKKERKFFKKHPDLLQKYSEILKKLENNPFEQSLKLHKLKGNLNELHACSLTYEYRIICTVLIKNDEIILINIGTHDDVYC